MLIVKVMQQHGDAADGYIVFVSESRGVRVVAGAATVVCSVALLLEDSGSAVALLTIAVLLMLPVADDAAQERSGRSAICHRAKR